MLKWWLGKPIDGSRVRDDNPEDAPETPAPVFAARALKSAIFGTPALPDDDTIHYDIDGGTPSNRAIRRSPSNRSSVHKPNTNAAPRPLSAGNLSPTKPPGILLTPGTGTTRRKTVSFGTDILAKGEMNTGDTEDGKDVNFFGSNDEQPARTGRKTSFGTKLENARERRKARAGGETTQSSLSELNPLLTLDSGTDSKRNSSENSGGREPRKTGKSNQELLTEHFTGHEPNRDMTVDLNEPCSQSGRFWKSEYQCYHDEAKSAMMQLLRYKQLATSYAKKKDDEANELAARLKEEQQRVLDMENKVSKLSAKIKTGAEEGKEEESPELMKELARQTALAVQYRAQVEDFETTVERTKGTRTSPRTQKTLVDTTRELKKAREQVREIASLRDELANLRQTLSTTEKTNQKLQEENTRLTRDLLHAEMRLENQVEKSEKQLQSSEEYLKKKEESLRSLQKDYDHQREQSRLSRRDAEHLLKQKGDQMTSLRKEVASLKGSNSTIKDLQAALEKRTAELENKDTEAGKKDAEHSQIVAGYLKRIDDLKATLGEDLDDMTESENVKFDLDERTQKPPPPKSPVRSLTSNDFYPRESLIPISVQSLSRPPKSMAPSRGVRSNTPTGSPSLRTRASYPALSEITNNASSDRAARKKTTVQDTPLAFKKSDLVQATPFANRADELTFSELDMEFPSPEPSLPFISRIQEKRAYSSPRPSMFNIASSPPKPVMVRPRPCDELSRQKSTADLTGRRLAQSSSSRGSNLEGSNTSKARSSLPPERAAAAKARLEQKNAEKKRAQALAGGKENVRN